MTRLSAICLLVLGLAACERRAPAPPPTPPPAPVPVAPPPRPISVPRGCEVNLGGHYHHQRDPRFTYTAADDGKKATFTITAQPNAPEGEKPMVIEVERTPDGFKGTISGEVKTREGKLCPVSFAAEITACDGSGVTMKTEDAYGIDARCQRAAGDTTSTFTENVLVRE